MITGNGYDNNKGKSINALNAESKGLYPISFIASELGLEPETIKKHFKAREWHHTSFAYNRTYYYDLEFIENSLTESIRKDNDEIKAYKELEKDFDNCFVQYRTKEKGRFVIKTIEDAKVVLKGSTAKVRIPVPDTDQFVFESMRLSSKGFVLLTEQDKELIDSALKPLLEREFFKAIHEDDEQFHGIKINDAGEYSQYKKTIKYKQIAEQEIKRHIYSSGTVDECLAVIDELVSGECSMTNKNTFLIASNNVKNTTQTLYRNGIRLQQYPTMGSLIGIQDPEWEEQRLFPIKRFKNIMFSAGYLTRAARYFNNHFDKAPRSKHMNRNEKIKKMMSVIAVKNGLGNLQLNDEWVSRLDQIFEKIQQEDLRREANSKQQFFENLKYKGFIDALKEKCNTGNRLEDMHYWNMEKNIFDVCVLNNLGTFKVNKEDTAKLHQLLFNDDERLAYRDHIVQRNNDRNKRQNRI